MRTATTSRVRCAIYGLAMLLTGSAAARAQTPAATPATMPAAIPAQDRSAADKAQEGVLIDQVVAIVNGELILESDVDQERRFAVFQPFSTPADSFTRQKAVDRLIDRTLILQQARLQPDDGVSDADVQAELMQLRKEIPACKAAHCETEAGWEKFVAAQGFTVAEVTKFWRERMQVLKFIELRFRMGVRILPAQIQEYYEKTMLPEYTKQHVAAPKLDTITDRIQEILLQQQVSSLLGDWLTTLKAEGNVRVIAAGEVAP